MNTGLLLMIEFYSIKGPSSSTTDLGSPGHGSPEKALIKTLDAPKCVDVTPKQHTKYEVNG